MEFLAKRRHQRTGSLLLQVLIISSLLLVSAVPASAQTDLTGVWAMEFPTGDGNIIKTYLDLKQSGEQITGAVWYDYGKRPSRKEALPAANCISPSFCGMTIHRPWASRTARCKGKRSAYGCICRMMSLELALPVEPLRKRWLCLPVCRFQTCTTSPITVWLAPLPWDGTVGTNSPRRLTTFPSAAWPTLWSRAACATPATPTSTLTIPGRARATRKATSPAT